MSDVIDERNQKEKIKRSIIKRWNIHYLSKAELEEQQRQEEIAKANEILERLNAEAAEDEAKKQAEIEAIRKAQEEAFNQATKSHSGFYGAEEIENEETKEKINQILGEKEKDFDATLQNILNQKPEVEDTTGMNETADAEKAIDIEEMANAEEIANTGEETNSEEIANTEE